MLRTSRKHTSSRRRVVRVGLRTGAFVNPDPAQAPPCSCARFEPALATHSPQDVALPLESHRVYARRFTAIIATANITVRVVCWTTTCTTL